MILFINNLLIILLLIIKWNSTCAVCVHFPSPICW